MPRMSAPYPAVEDIIHGVTVKDPYRWLEDRSLPETEEWLQNQKRRCDEYFAGCPDIDRIRERVREYLDVEVMDQPARIGEKLFFRRRARGQEQGCIYVRENGIDRLLVDPSPEGIFVSIGIHRISCDGRFLAYERKEGGEDTKEIHVVNVETSQRLSTYLERGFARGFVFTTDNRGFYCCHETPNATGDHEIRLRLFDESVEDQVVFRAARSHGTRLVLTADELNIGAIWYRNDQDCLRADFWMTHQCEPYEWIRVAARRELPFGPILKNGRIFALIQASNSGERLVELDQAGNVIKTIIPNEFGTLRNFVVGDCVYALFYSERHFILRIWTFESVKLACLSLPHGVTVQLLPNYGDGKSLFFTTESFIDPVTVHEYVPSPSQTLSLHQVIVEMKSPSSLHIREEAATANDGISVPVTLVSSRPSTTASPTIMTGYGGFGIPASPQFSVLVSILLELGVTFALAHVRGGSDFGRAWFSTARGRKRQRSIDDFTTVAEWLFQEEIASRGNLAIFGGSNAGLLVAAAMANRPELFRVVLCIAPLLDMVRYALFDDAWKWRAEYGSNLDSGDFRALYAYSPYHHVQADTNYPAVLFISGDRDSRCNPAHTRKMTAILQNRVAQDRAVLLDYRGERGHSPVLPLTIRIDSLARRIAFVCRELNISWSRGEKQ